VNVGAFVGVTAGSAGVASGSDVAVATTAVAGAAGDVGVAEGSTCPQPVTRSNRSITNAVRHLMEADMGAILLE
jgi:hypothetical protein